MNWRIVLPTASGFLTVAPAIGRFEDRKTGFILWPRIVTTALIADLGSKSRSGTIRGRSERHLDRTLP